MNAEMTPTGIAPEVYQLFVGIAGLSASHDWLRGEMLRAYYAALASGDLDAGAHRGIINELLALCDAHRANELAEWLVNEYGAWL